MPDLREEIQRRRTFAIISHPDAGKTTLTEKLLLYGGAIQTAGSVKGKATSRHAVSDWMDLEKQRGISITSSVLQFEYEGYCINILDTPGHQDFSEDTYRTLMAADSAVMVLDAAKGIEPQTRKLFKVCAMRHIPIFTFINKMDREARDPYELMEELENEFGIGTYPINWPIGCGQQFKGVYDRETRKILAFTEAHRGQNRIRATAIPADDVETVDSFIGPRLRKTLFDDVELIDDFKEVLFLVRLVEGDGIDIEVLFGGVFPFQRKAVHEQVDGVFVFFIERATGLLHDDADGSLHLLVGDAVVFVAVVEVFRQVVAQHHLIEVARDVLTFHMLIALLLQQGDDGLF